MDVQNEAKFEPGMKAGCGITTVNCLFCKDQIAASSKYVENYSRISWKRSGCMKASCTNFYTDQCPEYSMEGFDYKVCPLFVEKSL